MTEEARLREIRERIHRGDAAAEAVMVAAERCRPTRKEAAEVKATLAEIHREALSDLRFLLSLAARLRRALQAIAKQPCECGSPPYDDGNPCGRCYARAELQVPEATPESVAAFKRWYRTLQPTVVTDEYSEEELKVF